MFTTRAANQSEKLSAEALENIALGLFPLAEKLFAELKRLEVARAELNAAIAATPETGQRWLGLNFADRVVQRYRAALLNEFTRMLTSGPPTRPDFTAMRDVLERMRCALDTISASVSGNGKGRTLYRAVGTVSGISGGLTIDHGEVVALLENAETKKLVESGALEIATTTEETTK